MTTTENTTTTIATPTTKKTKAPTKKAAPSSNGDLHPNKMTILKKVNTGAYTIGTLAEKSKLTRRAAYHAIWGLREDGYIKSKDLDVDGVKEMVFILTAKGSKAIT